MSPAEFDAWVRLIDYEEGGDASWYVDPDDEKDRRVYDAEGDPVAICTSRAAAVVVAAALNRLLEECPDNNPGVMAARLRRSS